MSVTISAVSQLKSGSVVTVTGTGFGSAQQGETWDAQIGTRVIYYDGEQVPNIVDDLINYVTADTWSDTEITFTFERTTQPYSVNDPDVDAFYVVAYVILGGSVEVEGAIPELIAVETSHVVEDDYVATWMPTGTFAPRSEVAQLFANFLGRATNTAPWLFAVRKATDTDEPSGDPGDWLTVETTGVVTNMPAAGTGRRAALRVYRPGEGWIGLSVNWDDVQDINKFLLLLLSLSNYGDTVIDYYREVMPPQVAKPCCVILQLFGSVESAFGGDVNTSHRRYEIRIVGPALAEVLEYNSTVRSALKRNAGGIVQDIFLVNERTYYDDPARLYVASTEYEVHFSEI